MPPGFYFPTRDSQLWTMLMFRDEDFADRTNNYIHGLARLKPGVTFEQSRAELRLIAGRLARDIRTPTRRPASATSASATTCLRDPPMLLAPAVRPVPLPLTCANLANLLLARAPARERSWRSALRSALAGNG